MTLLWKEIFCLNYFIHLLTDLSIPVGLVLSHYHLFTSVIFYIYHPLSQTIIPLLCLSVSSHFSFSLNLPSLIDSLFVYNSLILPLCLHSALSHYLSVSVLPPCPYRRLSRHVRIRGSPTLSVSEALFLYISNTVSLPFCIQ